MEKRCLIIYQLCLYYHSPRKGAEVQFNSYTYRRELFRNPGKIVQSMLVRCHVGVCFKEICIPRDLFLIIRWPLFIPHKSWWVYNLLMSENLFTVHPLNHVKILRGKATWVAYIHGFSEVYTCIVSYTWSKRMLSLG